MTNNKCKAILQSGKVCKRKAQKNSNYCWTHRDQNKSPFYKNPKVIFLVMIIGILITLYQIYDSPTKKGQKKLEENQELILYEAFGEKISRSMEEKKTLQQKEEELAISINFIDEFLLRINENRWEYTRQIAGELYMLICFGNIKLEPLLLNLSEEKGIILDCYAKFLDKEDLKEDPKAPTLSALFPPYVSYTLKEPFRLKKMRFKDWLEKPIYKNAGDIYNSNEIIRMVAETEGGTRYSETMPEKLKKLKEFIFKNNIKVNNFAQQLIIDVANYVVIAGRMTLDGIDPNTIIADKHFHRGGIYLSEFKYKLASKEFRNAIKYYNISEYKGEYLNNFELLGVAFFFAGDNQNSEKYLRKAIERNPKSVGAYYNLGLVIYNQTRYLEALELLNKVIEIDSNFSLSYYQKGNILRSIEQYSEAIKMYEKFINKQPNDSLVNVAKSRVNNMRNILSHR